MTSADAGGLRVLVVDDDEEARSAVRRALHHTQICATIREAIDVASALRIALDETFDCILLDYSLPDGDGFDLLRLLAERDRLCATILLTGMDDEDMGVKALGWGAEDYLVKGSFDLASLKRSIRYAVERHRGRRELERVSQDLQRMNVALTDANRALEELSQTDSLTGVPNHRAFQDHLSRLMAEGRRGRAFALVIGDIDHFKKFNDEFGHEAGDDVLIAVARTLAASIRVTDFVSRYGGEEFAVLIADVDEPRAAIQVERLQEAVRSISTPYRQITMSFGVCAYDEMTVDGEVLFRAADRALYAAKQSGRDRICQYLGLSGGPKIC